jgi:hypothetical protein
MNEFQLTLTNTLRRHGMSVSDLARHTGYDPLLFESIVTGKSRQVPADFFIRIADILGLGTLEKDALVRSWAFERERWNWSHSREGRPTGPAKRRTG